MTNGTPSVCSAILIPGIITLAVTLLRLIGEIGRWNETFFNRSVGGGGAVVGISWLAIIFAIYFGLKLRKTDAAIQRKGKAIGLAVLACVLFVGGTFMIFRESGGLQSAPFLISGLVIIVAGIWVMRLAWPAYWNIMMGYALAARIPVLVVMYLAMSGNWGTHYDAVPPNETFSGMASKFVQLGLVPQIFFWIPYTVVLCGLIGTVVAAIGKTPSKVDVS